MVKIRLYKSKRNRKIHPNSIFIITGLLVLFFIGIALAASPFTWNVNSPANTDAISVFPTLDRADKSVIGAAPSATGGVLGTLSPYGTTTTGFRENQLNDDSWLCQNAYYTSATVANRDDIAKNLLCITEEISGPFWRFMYANAAVNPITFVEALRIVPVPNTVNLLEFDSSATGNGPRIIFKGTDATVNGTIETKGGVQLKLVDIASLVNSFQFTGKATGNSPDFSFTGSDATVGGTISTKGGVQLKFVDVASLANFFQFSGTATGADPTLSIKGDTNRGLVLALNGTGFLNITQGTPGSPIIQFNGVSPSLVEKTGSGAGNYTTTSATYIDVDATNLSYTVTVPLGWKIRIVAMATTSVSFQSQFGLGISDGTTLLKETIYDDSQISFRNSTSVQTIFTGDGASHTFKMRFHADGANTGTIVNNTSTIVPTLDFILIPSS